MTDRDEPNPATGTANRPQRAAFRWAMTAVLALAICAGPLWLWSVPLGGIDLKLDDFVYLARSRTPLRRSGGT